MLALAISDLEANCGITNVKNVCQSPRTVHNTHLAHDLDRNATPDMYKSINTGILDKKTQPINCSCLKSIHNHVEKKSNASLVSNRDTDL